MKTKDWNITYINTDGVVEEWSTLAGSISIAIEYTERLTFCKEIIKVERLEDFDSSITKEEEDRLALSRLLEG